MLPRQHGKFRGLTPSRIKQDLIKTLFEQNGISHYFTNSQSQDFFIKFSLDKMFKYLYKKLKHKKDCSYMQLNTQKALKLDEKLFVLRNSTFTSYMYAFEQCFFNKNFLPSVFHYYQSVGQLISIRSRNLLSFCYMFFSYSGCFFFHSRCDYFFHQCNCFSLTRQFFMRCAVVKFFCLSKEKQ